MAAAGVPTRRALLERRGAPCVLKADGLAAGKGVVVCQTRGRARRAGSRPSRGARRPRSSSRSCSKAPRCRVFALCDGDGRARAAAGAGLQARLRRRRGPEHRRDGLVRAGPRLRATTPSTSSSRRASGRCSRELARRGHPFVGTLFAGLMLTADGPQRARVQLPLRRPRDAVACCRSSTATCSPRSPLPRPASRRRRARACGAARPSPSCSRRGDYPAPATAARRSTGIDGGRGGGRARLPRRARRCTTAGSSRTAAASSASPRRARPRRRRATAPTRRRI